MLKICQRGPNWIVTATGSVTLFENKENIFKMIYTINSRNYWASFPLSTTSATLLRNDIDDYCCCCHFSTGFKERKGNVSFDKF